MILGLGWLLAAKTTQAGCVGAGGTNSNACTPNSTPCYVTNDWGIGGLWCCDNPIQCTEIQNFGTTSDTTGTDTGNLPAVNNSNANSPNASAATANAKQICDFVPANKQGDCTRCMSGGTKVWTAIGCIETTPQGIFSQFFTLGIGMAGGIAFLLILFGGFQVLTSSGNPEQLNAGRELIGAAITGLLLIIFSVFILRLVGYNILGIPGFG